MDVRLVLQSTLTHAFPPFQWGRFKDLQRISALRIAREAEVAVNYPMGNFDLPVQYWNLTEIHVQFHIRHCANTFSDSDRMELLFCGTETTVSIETQSFAQKPADLYVLLRSGSLGRKQLMELRSTLENRGHRLKFRFSAKRKLLSNMKVQFHRDDPLLPSKVTQVLSLVADHLACPVPLTFVAGYYASGDGTGLPGDKKFLRPSLLAGYLAGRIVGHIAYKITNLFMR